MKAIMAISDRVIVIHHGVKIADGHTAGRWCAIATSSSPISASEPLDADDRSYLQASYGKVQTLWEIGFEVPKGEIVALIGAMAPARRRR